MLSIIFNTSDFLAHVALIIEEENMKKYENTYQVWYGLLINYTCITLIYFQNIAINPTLFCKNSFCEGFLLDVTWLQGFAPIDSEVRHWCWAMRTGTQSAFQFPSKVFSLVQVLGSGLGFIHIRLGKSFFMHFVHGDIFILEQKRPSPNCCHKAGSTQLLHCNYRYIYINNSKGLGDSNIFFKNF